MTDAMRAEYLEGQGYDAQNFRVYRYGAYAKKYPDSCGEEWQSKKEWGEIGGLRAVFEYRAYIAKKLLEEKEV